ncbi:MAG: ATP:Cob(I)alamin adenosyltransferase [Ignavibacteriae bacterium]|nr:MAG: ATP:Cob(I)alamin adenosyltransferase [Ignavibacteriota bacterium]
MKIYTKTGDDGTTSLYGGKRVLKCELRIEAYGTVDELNSVLGICRAMKLHKRVDRLLDKIQNQLFVLGTDLATPKSSRKKPVPRIKESDIKFLEKAIDEFDAENKPLNRFILPGGSLLSSYLHFGRTVCRRAERLVVRLAKNENTGQNPIIYLNRLSDLLFVLARWVNKEKKSSEKYWVV